MNGKTIIAIVVVAAVLLLAFAVFNNMVLSWG